MPKDYYNNCNIAFIITYKKQKQQNLGNVSKYLHFKWITKQTIIK